MATVNLFADIHSCTGFKLSPPLLLSEFSSGFLALFPGTLLKELHLELSCSTPGALIFSALGFSARVVSEELGNHFRYHIMTKELC